VRSGILAILLLPAVALLCSCGGSDAPDAPVQNSVVNDLRDCLEGSTARTATPGEFVPELGDTPSGPDIANATRSLVVYWSDTKDSAEVYFASSEQAAADAVQDLGSGVKQKGELIVVPDADHPPTPDDEQLLIDDCLL
jgi:hypothetical protein